MQLETGGRAFRFFLEGAVGQALLENRPIGEVPENPWRRWRLHLEIGQVF
jgi:hypothetical protein